MQMTGRDHYFKGEDLLKKVEAMVIAAGQNGSFASIGDKTAAEWLAILAQVHFAAAIAFTATFGVADVRTVTR